MSRGRGRASTAGRQAGRSRRTVRRQVLTKKRASVPDQPLKSSTCGTVISAPTYVQHHRRLFTHSISGKSLVSVQKRVSLQKKMVATDARPDGECSRMFLHSTSFVLSQFLFSLQFLQPLSFDVPINSGSQARLFELLGIVDVSDDADGQKEGTEKGQLRLQAAAGTAHGLRLQVMVLQAAGDAFR